MAFNGDLIGFKSAKNSPIYGDWFLELRGVSVSFFSGDFMVIESRNIDGLMRLNGD